MQKQKWVEEGLLIEKESNVLEPPRCTGEVDLARLWIPQGMEKWVGCNGNHDVLC